MKRSLVQIGQLICVLVLVLSVPLFIEYLSDTKYSAEPQITLESASIEQETKGGQVLGVSNDRQTTQRLVSGSGNSLQTFLSYSLVSLLVLSILSFVHYKLRKNTKKYG